MNPKELGTAALTKDELRDIEEYKDRRVVVWLNGEPLMQHKLVHDIADYVNSDGKGGNNTVSTPAARLTTMLTNADVKHTVWRCSEYDGIVIFRLLSERGGWRNVFAVSHVAVKRQECSVAVKRQECSVAGILARRAHGR